MNHMTLRPVVFVLTVLLAMFTAAPGLADVADEAAGRESVTPQVTEPDPGEIGEKRPKPIKSALEKLFRRPEPEA